MARELQRTYRGRAERPEDERRPVHPDPNALERAALIASFNCSPVEQGDRVTEITELLRTAGAEVVHLVVQRRDRPDPRLYLGRGRLEELSEWVTENTPDLVACEGDLSAGQQRHLEDKLKTRVVDRTGLILDIFALHARSAEGKLQVELAQMEYSYSRQEGLWQHLERLGGGVGTRGPGESQLETDRRIIRSRMGVLRQRLAEVARSRETMREERLASPTTRVALAGYTNAGKSSLMNALTGADMGVNDALFETLDATTRAFSRDGIKVLVSDTVGFIRHLPHQLVESFRSTLDEVRDAHLILHVADASDDDDSRAARALAVDTVLDEIDAGDVPRLLVLNKVDRLDEEERHALLHRHPGAILTSAHSGEGIDDLRDYLLATARGQWHQLEVEVPYSRGDIISAIYAAGRDVHQDAGPEGTVVRALLPPVDAARIRAMLSGSRGV
ncbi:MAG: GTPase HflX [Thermoleophilia bacterium]|nr:GTPase HflX [Thermoleophilia bacterium]